MKSFPVRDLSISVWDLLCELFRPSRQKAPSRPRSFRPTLEELEGRLTPSPAVTGVSPNSGPTSGGMGAVLTGSDFTHTTGVSFGGTPAAGVFVINDTEIEAYVPSHAAGTVDITVTAPDGTSPTTSADQFTYQGSQAATSAILYSDANPSSYGQTVTFTALVSSQASGTPTGTVTFEDGGTVLGTGTLSAAWPGAAVASYTTSSPDVGNHNITAVYGGDVNFAGSTSPALMQVVQKANTTTVLISSNNPSAPGQAVAFTATVQGASGGEVTGTVTFSNGQVVLGTATLTWDGTVNRATLVASIATPGNNAITAAYGGDRHFNGSNSAAINQTVRAPTDNYWTDAVGDFLASDPGNWSAGAFVEGDRLIVDGIHAPRSNDALTFDRAPTDANGNPLLASMSVLLTYTNNVTFTRSPRFAETFLLDTNAPVSISGGTIEAPNISLSATVSGPGDLEATGGGAVDIDLAILSNLRLKIDGGSTWSLGGATLFSAEIDNFGQGTWIGADVALDNGSVIYNDASFDVTCDRKMTTVGGGAFYNSGAFEKDADVFAPGFPAGLGRTDMEVIFSNSPLPFGQGGVQNPSVTVQSDMELDLDGGGIDSAPYTVNADGVLDFGGGNKRLLGDSTSFSGAGSFFVDEGADADIIDGSTIPISTGTFTLTGTQNFNPAALDGTPGPQAPANTPHGTFLITSPLANWNGGSGLMNVTVEVTGAFDIGNSTVGGNPNDTMADSSLLLEGTTTWDSTFHALSMNDSEIDNGGMFTATTGQTILDDNKPAQGKQPTSTFINDGTLSKTPGSAATTIGVAFVNKGALNFNGTTILFQETVQQTGAGAVTDLGGGTMTLTGQNLPAGAANPTTFLLAAGELTGAAGATINGDVSNGGTVDFGSAFGTLTITGNYTQVAGATVKINTSASSGTDALNVGGQASLGGHLQISGAQGVAAFDILQVSGGVAGAFGDATAPWSVVYLANDVWVQ